MHTLSLEGPSTVVPLALLADLKADLGITDGTTDTTLAGKLMDASSMVLDYIGRPLLSGEWTEEFVIEGGDLLKEVVLSVRPLVSISSISRNGQAWTSDQLEDLVLDKRAGILSHPTPTRRRWQHGVYCAVYTAGYAPPQVAQDGTVTKGTLPQTISRATVLAAAAMVQGAGRDPNLKSESVQGVGSTSWNIASGTGGLPQQVADMLASYRGAHL